MAGSLRPRETKKNKFHFGYIILIVSIIILGGAIGYVLFEKNKNY
jgi:prolipoprotein diacylglyceryltransferase